MRFVNFQAALLGIALLANCSSVQPSSDSSTDKNSSTNSSKKVSYFSKNGFGNAVALVQHPAGEYRDGITYVSYQGDLEDPYVAAYNHETDEWIGPYKAGVSDMGKDPNRKKIDNHGKPTMIIDNDGFIHIFFGGHGGMPEHGPNPLGNYHYGKNKHVVSKRPLDITEWEELDTIPPFGTYNQAFKMENGDLFVFYRHGAHRSDWVYQKSTDNGRTFADPVSILKHKRRTDIAAVDSWYPSISRGPNDELHVSFDYHLCLDNKPSEGLVHRPERYNLYYMKMETSTNTWKNVRNETLDLPVTKEYADEHTLVANTGKYLTFNGSNTLSPDGNPQIGAFIGEDDGTKLGLPKSPRHLKWTGTQWTGGLPNKLPVSRGPFRAFSEQDIEFILASRSKKGGAEIAKWRSDDGGLSFKKDKVLLHSIKAKGFSISDYITNGHPDAQLIVSEIQANTNKRRMYLLGANGPIAREKHSTN